MGWLKANRGVITAIALAAAVPAVTLYAAEKHTAEAVVPWEGSGVIFLTHMDKAKFFGEINATMSIKRDGNETFGNLPLVCMTVREIDLNGSVSSTRGDCLIGVQKDVIFAAFECSGPPDDCNGTMTLGGGTGQYSGINGSGGFRCQTEGDTISLEKGRVLANKKTKGVMTLSDLVYEIPGQQ